MCKHKHALKGKMIRGIQKRSSPDPRLIQIQLFFSAGKSSFHFSHGPASRATNTGRGEMLRKPYEDISGGTVGNDPERRLPS